MILLAVLAHVYEFDDKPLNKKMYRGKRDAVYTLHLLTELCSVRTASLRKRCGLALAYALGRFNLSFAYVLGSKLVDGR